MGAFVGALAAGAGTALAGKLFGGEKQGSPQTTTQTSTTQMSPWEDSYWQSLTNRAQQLANQPFQPYQGQMVAGLSNEQQAGINHAVNTSDQWRTPLDAATSAYGSALNPINSGDINQFMSPYMGDVVSNIQRIGNENFSAPGGVADTIAGDFTGLGQYGSRRMGEVMNRAGQLNERETQGQVSNALNSGYNTALNEANAQKAQELWGAGGLSSLAGQEQSLNQGETNSLLGVGGLEQTQAQNQLNAPYQQYLMSLQYPLQALQTASGVRPPFEGTSSGSVTSPGPFQPNGFNNFMGGVGMYLGAKENGMFNGSPANTGAMNSAMGPSFDPVDMAGNYGAFDDFGGGDFYGVGGAPYRKGGLAQLKYADGGSVDAVMRANGDLNDDEVVQTQLLRAKGGWIKGAIKHPGALHAMMHVPQGEKIPAKRLHAAANKGGVLGRRARFAEELEGFHHHKKGGLARLAA